MSSGIFEMPPGVVLMKKIEGLEERLRHSNKRYTAMRNIISFYEILGARDAAIQTDRYRLALEAIVTLHETLDPMCSDMTDTGRMADIARDALEE